MEIKKETWKNIPPQTKPRKKNVTNKSQQSWITDTKWQTQKQGKNSISKTSRINVKLGKQNKLAQTKWKNWNQKEKWQCGLVSVYVCVQRLKGRGDREKQRSCVVLLEENFSQFGSSVETYVYIWTVGACDLIGKMDVSVPDGNGDQPE